MNWFPSRPLGTRIPDLLHAVSCSMPTMRDVIGYETKDAATLAQMSSGYPRFMVHPLLIRIEQHWRRERRLDGAALWLVTSQRMAEQLAAHLAPAAARVLEDDGIHAVAHADELELRRSARLFLQHTGGFLSSRAAEDYAVAHGLVPARTPEETWPGDAARRIRETMQPLLGAAHPGDVWLAPSGMNAFWASFCAVNRLQRPAGRDTWLQVGWLYLDTAAILAKFTGGRIVRVFDVHDRRALEAAFREHGPRLAGVVTEVMTNPLMQTADLPALAALARQHGAFCVVDPSIASPYNVDVAPHADLVLSSLTKYAAAEGDVIAGAVALTPACRQREALQAALAAELEPLHARDAARLAAQIGGYADLLHRANASARAVVDHLNRRPRGVRRVLWSHQPSSDENYRRIARRPGETAPMLSFAIAGPLEAFYDAVPLAKGPSFGMRTSLLCPFIYLAHYDLVTSDAGRALLASAGVPPDLLRFSIGVEPADAIIDALEQGLAAAERA